MQYLLFLFMYQRTLYRRSLWLLVASETVCVWFACVVACIAVFPGIKGNFAVMADTALFTLHDKVIRNIISAFFHYKYILMAHLALEPYPMKPVRENNRRKVFCLQAHKMVFNNYIA